jgi:hypothetical protein
VTDAAAGKPDEAGSRDSERTSLRALVHGRRGGLDRRLDARSSAGLRQGQRLGWCDGRGAANSECWNFDEPTVAAPGGPLLPSAEGPTFLIEYVNEQNNANHVHAAWRDLNGDYGRDLIQGHLQTYPHGEEHEHPHPH